MQDRFEESKELYIKILDVNTDFVTKTMTGVFKKDRADIKEFFNGKIRYIKNRDQFSTTTIVRIDKEFLTEKTGWSIDDYDNLASWLVVPIIDAAGEEHHTVNIKKSEKDLELTFIDKDIALQKIYFPTVKQRNNLVVMSTIDLDEWSEDDD